MERLDTERLVKHCKHMATQLLIEQNGEFHPIAGSIDTDGTFTYQALYDGDEFPLSDTLIGDFKILLEKQFEKKTIRAYAIAYDVQVTSQKHPDKIDAIAIFVKHDGKQPINYYYPYLIENKEISFFEPWGEYTE